ncbi:MAG: hypothetical protein ACRDNP_01295 [Gaiellaceae bacterium]
MVVALAFALALAAAGIGFHQAPRTSPAPEGVKASTPTTGRLLIGLGPH